MSELIFIFNNADWPVLLINAEGNICHGNPAAVAVFGPAVKNGAVLLSDIWSVDNPQTPKNFLTDLEHASHGTTPLKFRSQTGSVISFVTSLCVFNRDNRNFFLLQLLPPPTPKPAAALPVSAMLLPQTGQTDIIQKQKLDCAMQLARTMALDFNNALTSILGHTLLILGRMEPTHPWRASLVEVEKSAARAAEIASDLATFSRQEKDPPGQISGNLNQLLQLNRRAFPKLVVRRCRLGFAIGTKTLRRQIRRGEDAAGLRKNFGKCRSVARQERPRLHPVAQH